MNKYILNGLLFCVASFVTVFSMAQNNGPVALGIKLEGYRYPCPVKYITLFIQGQQLKMAYMDVTPSQPNGQTAMLLHDKKFVTLIGSKHKTIIR